MKLPYDKSQLIDTMGRPLTQGLFLEPSYDTKFALFTKGDDHKKYKGKTYWSLKKYYLEFGDVEEYHFANTYLLGWDQWKRFMGNKALASDIEDWREELELKTRSEAISSIKDMTENFQALKYIANGDWKKSKGVGRPKKDTSERDTRIEERLNEEFSDDVARLSDYKRN